MNMICTIYQIIKALRTIKLIMLGKITTLLYIQNNQGFDNHSSNIHVLGESKVSVNVKKLSSCSLIILGNNSLFQQ